MTWPKLTLPTWITLSRLLAIPVVLIVLQNPSAQQRWVGLSVFLIAAATDWVDGFLARKLDQVTEMGKFLDPLVDKLLVLAPLLALIGIGQVPAWGVFLILARELTIAGWRVNPTLFTGGNQVTGANFWGKAKTVSQILAISLLIAPLPPQFALLGTVSFWFAVGLTIVSGLIYLQPRPQS